MLPGGTLPGDEYAYEPGLKTQAALRIRDNSSIGVVPDTDGDGVDDLQEVKLVVDSSPWGGGMTIKKYPTNPLDRDSDGDGRPDGFVWNDLTDWDSDGITDLMECWLGLIRTDSDADGISDSLEILRGTNPTAAPINNDVTPPNISLTSPVACNNGCKIKEL